MTRALLVAGTTSDAGKSVVTAGICRWLYRQGVHVAPFKAQNMSNNSVVALDSDGSGGEIGRAQALQAAACGLPPSVRFNPVLLKPGSDHSSQVVVLGRAWGSVTARNFAHVRKQLKHIALATLAELRADYDVVICEGAGSPAEINLRAGDYVNLGLARAASIPSIVVGDIDRGGVFAALYGTLAILDPADQQLIAGFVINKFRGDSGLLAPGIDELTRRTGRPTYGVLPWHRELWLDAEDSLAYGTGERLLGRPLPPRGSQWLRVAVVRYPRISNATDAEALAVEPGVRVRLTTEPAELADADVVMLPGSKATVADLDWLRQRGLADAIVAHARSGRPVVGVCGGFQMLAEQVHDAVESGRGTVAGLGLLPIEVTFRAAKRLTQPSGVALGAPVTGYEIHHGVISRGSPNVPPLIRLPDGTGEGAAASNVFGTHWHGTFECDGFRAAFLTTAAQLAGRLGFRVASDTTFVDHRNRALDILGDLIADHLDTAALWRLVEQGIPRDTPSLHHRVVTANPELG